MQRGTTLIELLSALIIIALLLGIAAPAVSNLKNRSEATSRVNWIIGAVNYTRHAAISFNTTATLCPLKKTKDKNHCGRGWHQDLLIFADKNKDGRFNGRDYLIQTIPALDKKGTIKWRSFRNRQFLQITSHGYTNFQNGNFTYCSPTKDPILSRQVVVNVQGRARVTHYHDDQGRRLDRKGKLLRC